MAVTDAQREFYTRTLKHAAKSGTRIRKGVNSKTVRALQLFLEDNGHSPGGNDGRFGPQTEAALKSYQKSAGTNVDGVAGGRTLKTITSKLPEVSRTPAAPAATAAPKSSVPLPNQRPAIDVMGGGSDMAPRTETMGQRAMLGTPPKPTPRPAPMGGGSYFPASSPEQPPASPGLFGLAQPGEQEDVNQAVGHLGGSAWTMDPRALKDYAQGARQNFRDTAPVGGEQADVNAAVGHLGSSAWTMDPRALQQYAGGARQQYRENAGAPNDGTQDVMAIKRMLMNLLGQHAAEADLGQEQPTDPLAQPMVR